MLQKSATYKNRLRALVIKPLDEWLLAEVTLSRQNPAYSFPYLCSHRISRIGLVPTCARDPARLKKHFQNLASKIIIT